MVKHNVPLLLILACVLSTLASNAQTTDTTLLQAVEVNGFYLYQLQSPQKITRIDSSILANSQAQNLAQVLEKNSTVYIKNYGPGQLASTAFRGGSSSHTAVIWNGVNLSSSMNGMIDLSLLPAALLDEVTIQYGASTALWGSGAVGGALLLNSKARLQTGWQSGYAASIGSFGQQKQLLKSSFGGKRLYTSLKFYQAKAKNDFTYAKEFKQISQRQKQIHSQLKSHGLLAETHLLLNTNHKLALHYWHQFTDRNLPPTLQEDVSTAWQKDVNHRLSLHYLFTKNKHTVHYRSAWLSDDFLYFNKGLGNSNAYADNWVNEAIWKQKLNKRQNLFLGTNLTQHQVRSKDFISAKKQNRLAAIMGFHQALSKNWKVDVNLRQEWIDQKAAPATIAFTSHYQLPKNLVLSGQFSTVYRSPNLNDLYWLEGGNPDLESEKGWATELGITWTKNFKKYWQAKIQVQGYYRQMDNWIIWTPGQPYWKPQNLLEVTSQGLETDWKLSRKKDHWNMTFECHTAYTHTFNTKATLGNSNTINKQLIYVPLYSGNTSLQLSYKNYFIQYFHTYTGYTYTLSDHSEYLKPYQTASLQFGMKKEFKKVSGQFLVGIQNLYNNTYQVVQNRPMPLQNFQISIQLSYRNKSLSS